jgi:phosphatidylinositol kinase/protein kinase (PI-3  family)
VSDELIRVAILWHELWHEGLEEASRLYFGERNVKGMFETLEPLHAMLDRGPQTLKETSFNQVSRSEFKCEVKDVKGVYPFNFLIKKKN